MKDKIVSVKSALIWMAATLAVGGAFAQKKPAAPAVPEGVVVDATGKAFGRVLGVADARAIQYGNPVLGSQMRIVANVNGTLTSLFVGPLTTNGSGPNVWPGSPADTSKLVPYGDNSPVYFTGSGCTGDAFTPSMIGVGGVAPSVTFANQMGSGTLYVASGLVRYDNISINSYLSAQGVCVAYAGTVNIVQQVTQVVDLATQFTAPYTLR